ncbi:MAG: 3-oxoacyl-[acyl-carrier-protein] reductase [bacterium]
MNLKNKVAIVTGGGRGIGKAIALVLAERGANIVLADLDQESLNQTCKEIEGKGVAVLSYKVDISKLDEVEAMIKKTVEKFGQIDILINNAGVTRDNLIMRMKREDWDLVLNINLGGAFNCIKAVTRPMMKKESGRIINISSVVGAMGNAGQANYSASKAGLIGLTKTIAKELASRNITVNAIAPGFIDTEMTKVLPDNVKEEMLRQIPLKRFGSVSDIAEVIAFLCSEAAGYITGQVIHVNGGMYV